MYEEANTVELQFGRIYNSEPIIANIIPFLACCDVSSYSMVLTSYYDLYNWILVSKGTGADFMCII